MQSGSTGHQTNCLAGDLQVEEHLNFFTGQFLAERDFRDEQSYHIGKHRQHNRYLHGYGTVCGLQVVQHPDPACRKRMVIVEPGLALDGLGREVVLKHKFYLDLNEALSPASQGTASAHQPDLSQPATTETSGTTPSNPHLLISLCYEEEPTEFVPALYAHGGCNEQGCAANRIRERSRIEVRQVVQIPEVPHFESIGVSLAWNTTLNLKHAIRLALDPTRKRLYVLTTDESSKQLQLWVYDSTHHCLLTSVLIERQGFDLAIAPTGDSLYLICGKVIPGTNTVQYFLRVLDAENLNQPIQDIELFTGPLANPPQVVVATTDGSGKVYVLDRASHSKKVIIWNAIVNNRGTLNFNLPPDQPNSPKYADDIQVGSDPRSIAVSPNGKWLFIAEAADGQRYVRAIKVETLIALSVVSYNISLKNEKPLLLSVSGDDQRLYIVTDAGNVRAFTIQEGTQPNPALGAFPEVGDGVSLGSDTPPVALVASPTAKWACVLLKDIENDGWVRVVNGERLKTDPSHALGRPIAMLAFPQDLLIDLRGQRAYASGFGYPGETCGGVSVLDVMEADCEEILWQALKGCVPCPEDLCVPLAVIRNYHPDMMVSDREIDNRIRPLVPSTETLRQLILCALEVRGKQGPEGPRGPTGIKGSDGSRWFNGCDKPDPKKGADGDYYLETQTGNVYRKDRGDWILIGNMKGPSGNVLLIFIIALVSLLLSVISVT
jgi:DNA-binding beta-propeller fold protein YncE